MSAKDMRRCAICRNWKHRLSFAGSNLCMKCSSGGGISKEVVDHEKCNGCEKPFRGPKQMKFCSKCKNTPEWKDGELW
jgi:hypothetical protein